MNAPTQFRISRLTRAPVAGALLFGLASIVTSSVLVCLAWFIYKRLAPDPFFTKLGDLILQLALLVILGALVKGLIDWGTSQHARHRERIENRMDFMKRARAMHVEVAYARDLLNAHRSGRTYGERLRRLILLRGEIVEDLRASPELFTSQGEVMEALQAIINYFDAGREEYILRHDDVDADATIGVKLDVTIRKKKMSWVEDFMQGGPRFQAEYDQNLDMSKGRMRRDVFGA